MTHSLAYTKAERIRSRSDYLRLLHAQKKAHAVHFIVVWSSVPGQTTRIGVTVSRKVGNAVQRNRIKRLIRECYRLHKQVFPAADINIIAKKGASDLTYNALCSELEGIFKKSLAS